jgi:hypothetical protein
LEREEKGKETYSVERSSEKVRLELDIRNNWQGYTSGKTFSKIAGISEAGKYF